MQAVVDLFGGGGGLAQAKGDDGLGVWYFVGEDDDVMFYANISDC